MSWVAGEPKIESEGLASLIYGLFLDFYHNVPAFSAAFNVGVSTREVGKAPNHQSQYLFTSQACVKGESNKNASVASLPGLMSLPVRRATSGPHCQQGRQPLLCTHRNALYLPSSRANGLLSARQCMLGPTWL